MGKLEFALCVTLVGLVSGRGLRSVCDEVCPDNFEGICGSDGHTYANVCALRVAGCLTGEDIEAVDCPEPSVCDDYNGETMCTMEYDPVCTPDGQEYGNLCALQVALCPSNDTVAVAECPEPSSVCDGYDGGNKCTLEYDPVCLADGREFGNLCALQVALCPSEEPIELVPCP